jgi:hypothetical protein
MRSIPNVAYVFLGLFILVGCKSFPLPMMESSTLPTLENYPDESRVVIRDERHLRFFPQDGKPMLEETEIKVERVLTQAALEKLAVRTTYDRTFTSVASFHVRTIRPNGDVELYTLEDALDLSAWPGSQLYVDTRIIVLRLPKEPLGTVVESVITRTHRRPKIRQYSFLFGDLFSSKNLIFTVSHPSDWNVDYVAHQLGNRIEFAPKIDESKPGLRKLTWRKSDVSRFVHEKDGPAFWRTVPTVNVLLNAWTIDGKRTLGLTTIADYVKWIYDLQNGADDTNAEMEALAKKVTQGAQSPREEAKRLYDWVQDNIRYVGVQIGLGGWRPFPATEVFENGYGDCKAKAVILKSLLKTVGISSSMVSLYSATGPPRRFWLPAIGNTNHAILAVDLPGGMVFADPTTRVVPFGELPASDQGQHILRLTQDSVEPFLSPVSTAEQNTRHSKFKFVLTNKGRLEGAFEYEAKGSFASTLEASDMDTSPDKPNKALRRALGLRSGGKLSEVKKDFDKSAIKNRTARISGKVLIKEATKASGKLKLLRLEDFLYSPSTKYPEERRKHSIYFGNRRIQETKIEINLPKDAVINQLPPDTSLSVPGLEYALEWKLKEETLVIERKYKRNKRFFSSSAYAQVQKFYNQLLEAEAKAVVIR